MPCCELFLPVGFLGLIGYWFFARTRRRLLGLRQFAHSDDDRWGERDPFLTDEEPILELELGEPEPRRPPPSILAFLFILFGIGMMFLTVFALGCPDWPFEQTIILVYLVLGDRLPGGRFIADHTRSLQQYYEERRWRTGCLGLMVYMVPYVNIFFLGRPMILAAWAVVLALPLELIGAALTYYVLPIPAYGPIGQADWSFWGTFVFEVILSVGIAPFLVMLALHIRWRIQ